MLLLNVDIYILFDSMKEIGRGALNMAACSGCKFEGRGTNTDVRAEARSHERKFKKHKVYIVCADVDNRISPREARRVKRLTGMEVPNCFIAD